ncbi:type II toxin-antitoxin system RelE/ParE family toxin [Desulfofundulus sp. TPOSR]|uniref:type II toxin-antitoxin system RelE family toxin n=1 Tax=Desulfofundulus sp. TPOSR TaxID=2714340 RepID=UPI00140E6A0E|nr:type II toxin-antitoxin system RelE/ParE family toxin [Desulfofundulus sp. TPOSR]NHM28022.1 type II toxin-antitoxin system RelE/ParE family toxin [Desulfofundulus sp. TPOSR]
MTRWTVKWLPEAVKDLEDLDKSVRMKVLKAALKLEIDPLKYGKPLGEKLGLDLVGLRKFNIEGYRLVYLPEEKTVFVAVIAVGKREGLGAYKTAAKRIAEYRKLTGNELKKLAELLK